MYKLSILIITLVLTSTTLASSECTKQWDKLKERDKVPAEYLTLSGMCGETLKRSLQTLISENQRKLHYNEAKRKVRKDLDFNEERGFPCSVYSPMDCEDNENLNLEHTWPRSKGANKKPAISDLHHLYMAEVGLNSLRSNHPFCDVTEVEYEYGGSRFGFTKNSRRNCFEPPASHKGNVARSMFYFSVRYRKKIGKSEERFFRKWHNSDPVNESDIIRNEKILDFQGNSNPFVDVPEFVNLISDF